MQVSIYNIIVRLYTWSIHVAALFNSKAKHWTRGRRNWKQNLSEKLSGEGEWIWVHCASLGEFEQGRPLIEALKRNYPDYRILLSFFSPSGYNVRKNYEKADAVVYLPSDSAANADYFVSALRPVLAIFIKYELWYHYLNALEKRNVNTILVSGIFRPLHPVFKWYGGIYRRMLQYFETIFLQDENSKKLLSNAGIGKSLVVAGDTRYDRVTTIAAHARKIEDIEKFAAGNKLLIAGSTWPADEKILKEVLPALPQDWKMVIAPHEISSAHLKDVASLFHDQAILYSELTAGHEYRPKRILIIDNIGMLASLYAYGSIAYVGGGFGKGIHNILEPAAFGLPVIFGPRHEKFVEANQFKEAGFGFSVNNTPECIAIMNKLIAGEEYARLKPNLQQFMANQTGATSRVMEYLNNHGWLKR